MSQTLAIMRSTIEERTLALRQIQYLLEADLSNPILVDAIRKVVAKALPHTTAPKDSQ